MVTNELISLLEKKKEGKRLSICEMENLKILLSKEHDDTIETLSILKFTKRGA